jgi:hypothetical protein
VQPESELDSLNPQREGPTPRFKYPHRRALYFKYMNSKIALLFLLGEKMFTIILLTTIAFKIRSSLFFLNDGFNRQLREKVG